jgi:hypothetical protein
MATGPFQAGLLTAGGVFHATDIANLIRQVNYLSGLPLTGDDERPMADLRQTVGQSIPNSAWTPLLFDSESLDTANGHSTTANTSRWTCPAGKGGWYWIKGSYVSGGSSTGVRGVAIQGNGVTHYGQMVVPASTSTTSLNVSDLISLSVGDYVETIAYQSSGGSLATDLSTVVTMSVFQMRLQ